VVVRRDSPGCAEVNQLEQVVVVGAEEDVVWLDVAVDVSLSM